MTKNEILKILEKYKPLVDENRWQEFFDNLNIEDRRPLAEFLLLDVGIDVLEYMTEIPSSMFFGTKRLLEIKIPKNIKKIGEEAFSYSSLSVIKLPPTIELAEGSFYASTLKNINLEEVFLTHIPPDTFSNCKYLRNIILPETLKVIGDSCFSASGLEEIIIPSNVTFIDDYAFSVCSFLEKVVFSPHVGGVIIGEHAFASCPRLTKIEGLTEEDLNSACSDSFFDSPVEKEYWDTLKYRD